MFSACQDLHRESKLFNVIPLSLVLYLDNQGSRNVVRFNIIPRGSQWILPLCLPLINQRWCVPLYERQTQILQM